LNDITKHFELESVYNDITENISIEGKNKKPFHIIVKMIICSNRPLEVNSGSDKDRVVEFEFSDFFSEKLSPQDHFGQWFFTDWNSLEWHRFDNFMLECVQMYLSRGIISPTNENLSKRKLVNQTNEDFLTFMEMKDIKPNFEYDKKALFNDFKNAYPDWNNSKFSQRRFTAWLRIFGQFSEVFSSFIERDDKNKFISYIEFLP
jgi:hypothetical protein